MGILERVRAASVPIQEYELPALAAIEEED